MSSNVIPVDDEPMSPSERIGTYVAVATPTGVLPVDHMDVGDSCRDEGHSQEGNSNGKTPAVNASSDVPQGGTTTPVDANPDELKNALAEKEKEEALAKFKFWDLYRYASTWDKIGLLVGLITTIANGALFPCMALIFGDAISSFQPYDQNGVNNSSILFLGIAVILFATDYVSYVLLATTAERQMKRLRAEAMQQMLYLDVTWYDQHDALQLSSRLNGDTVKIKEGMGQKLGDAFRFTAQFIAGYAIGFIKGWDIALLMTAVLPFIAVSLGWLIKTLQTRTEFAQKVYAQAGAVAEETLGSMRTIVSNNGEKRAIMKYTSKTHQAEVENISLARLMAMVLGCFFASIWFMYAAGLWYGGWRVSQDKSNPGRVFSAFFGVLIGSMSVAQISPNLSAVAEGKGAAAALYHILETRSKIDASTTTGLIQSSCSGRIEAIDVSFNYPCRPDVPILQHYSVTIEKGQTVAFVGASGGGKSTLVSLLERFYDPLEGRILLDGRDLKEYNVQWLRSQIGLVQQEPVLFAMTVLENIQFGHANVTREDAEAAAKLANAHEFITRLPQGYDTFVGEKGVSMSGGQKQRIAIARAIVRNPTILVLDEATSALDNDSERIVQAALNSLMEKIQMTTLVIAHRLSTIRHVDKIVVLSGGAVAEQGTHDKLMKYPDGLYRKLYTIQEGVPIDTSDDVAAIEREVEANAVSPPTLVTETVVPLDSARSDRSVREHIESPGNQVIMSSAPERVAKHFTLAKLVTLCAPERRHFFTGSVASLVLGISMPASALLISGMITSMTEKYMRFHMTQDHKYMHDLYKEVELYGSLYVGGAFVLMAAMGVETYCFRFMAEKLTSRLREMHFTALCRQNIGFFDDSKHATGALTADLSTNATKVALLSGDAQGRMIQAVFTLIAALVISFALGSWQLTLVMLSVFPLLIFAQVVRVQQMKGKDDKADALGESGAHASQALSNIRTVVSLGLESRMIEKYTMLLEKPLRAGTREANVNGLALGFSSFIVFAVYSLIFWYGGKLVQTEKIEFVHLMRTLMAIMMSSQSIGSAASWLADADKATACGNAIFELVDRVVPIDSFTNEGLKLDKVDGRLEFLDITFRYPTRMEITVLRHYNLTIEAGQTVAFCGPSGGGKSTIVALIERFYDPVSGSVRLDGHDLKMLNLANLRRHIGLVGQEPTLFIGTVAENIAYGLDTVPSQEEIELAAKRANAHAFITNFPDGYSTQVGMKGEKLSGGQKQRIAIARAILKDPSILLLDEATSALDSESEHVVQAALDQVVALKKRTTIVIAHRLSTIRKADKICVVSGGRIAEQGTHQELMDQKGIYLRLVTKGKE